MSRGVSGAEIVMSKHAEVGADAMQKVQARTGPDGCVSFEAPLDIGTFVAARNAKGRSSFKALTALPSHEEAVLQLLEDDFLLLGEVVDGFGRGVPNATVDIWEGRAFRSDAGASQAGLACDWRKVESGPDGRFEVRLCGERGPYHAIARSLGRTSLRHKLSLDDVDGREFVTMALPGRASLQGVVLDFMGNPAPDCEVLVAKESPGDQGVLARTDAAGQFTAWFFKGGNCTVTAMGNGAVAGGEPLALMLSEEAVTRVTIPTWEASVLRGSVINASATDNLRLMIVPQDKSRLYQREAAVGRPALQFEVGGLVRGWVYDICLYKGDEYLGLVTWQAGVGDVVLDTRALLQR